MNAKHFVCLFAAAICLIGFGMLDCRATTYYVATNGTGNGDSWTTATNSIQGAIDRTVADDIVLVSNGVYEIGGRTAGGGALTNRIVITNAITVRSANNDPATTIIKGAKDAGGLGPAAVRCVWMSAGVLSGFTITNGATLASGADADQRGGGVYCNLSAVPIVSNCVITGNSAGGGAATWNGYGGGVSCGTVSFCRIIGNSAAGGGGGVAGYWDGANHRFTVNNSIIVGNTAGGAGGANRIDMNNCLVSGNVGGTVGGGYDMGTLNNCTMVYNTGTGSGSAGGLAACVDIRNSIVISNTGVFASYQNYQPVAGGGMFMYSCTAPMPTGANTNEVGGNISSNPLFVNAAAGNYRLFGASPCVDKGTNVNTGTVDLDGKTRIYNGRVDMGAYEFAPTTYYVATNGTGNGDSWAAATNNIQGAIDRTVADDIVLVSNGVYEVGGRTAGGGTLTNRVVITNAITVCSANNDPANTIIKGAKDTGGLGPAAVRCVWMSAGVLSGFTVTNGATMASGAAADQRGGGVYCNLSAVPIVSNCVITGNSAGGGATTWNGFGGGVSCGTVSFCRIIGNSAAGGGGGVAGYWDGANHRFTVNNSIIVGNTAGGAGGANRNDLNNCLVAGNVGGSEGGGYDMGAINNSTIVYNTGTGAGSAGGVAACVNFRNSIVISNTGVSYVNYWPVDGGGVFMYSCTAPIPTGTNDGGGNISSNPLFVNAAAGNYRLQGTSPCINTGINTNTGTLDLDGRTRIQYGTVDMGAYEFIRSGAVFGFK